jgi:hypothetical protein
LGAASFAKVGATGAINSGWMGRSVEGTSDMDPP